MREKCKPRPPVHCAAAGELLHSRPTVKRSQIALQLYTLREFCRDRRALADTCRRIREIGYEAVQVSGVDRSVVPETEIRAIGAEHGLTICATHEGSEEILQNPARVVERLQQIGCSLTAYPFPKGFDLSDEAAVGQLIRALENAGQVLADAGLVLAYHHHHHEFRRQGGQLILEKILAETSPRHLQAELDTYWVQFGGGNPVSWCEQVTGRLPIIHLKDYRINAQSQVEFAEVGSGNLDMPAIIRAAEKAGCRWFAVEQDTCAGDPFEAITRSFRYLQGLCEPA